MKPTEVVASGSRLRGGQHLSLSTSLPPLLLLLLPLLGLEKEEEEDREEEKM